MANLQQVAEATSSSYPQLRGAMQWMYDRIRDQGAIDLPIVIENVGKFDLLVEPRKLWYYRDQVLELPERRVLKFRPLRRKANVLGPVNESPNARFGLSFRTVGFLRIGLRYSRSVIEVTYSGLLRDTGCTLLSFNLQERNDIQGRYFSLYIKVRIDVEPGFGEPREEALSTTWRSRMRPDHGDGPFTTGIDLDRVSTPIIGDIPIEGFEHPIEPNHTFARNIRSRIASEWLRSAMEVVGQSPSVVFEPLPQ